MTVLAFKTPRSLKRTRRTKAQMEAIRDAIFAELEETHPQTVRHVFYRMVAMGVVPKLEKLGYQTVMAQLLKMRKSGRIPWGWVADATRWRIKPTSYGSLEEALAHNARFTAGTSGPRPKSMSRYGARATASAASSWRKPESGMSPC